LLAVVLAGAAVAACGGGSGGAASGGGKSITVLITSSPSASALKSIAPGFTKQTGISVKFVTVPYESITTKLLLANRSGSSSYDVAQVDSPMMAPLVAAGALTPMKDFLAKHPDYRASDFPAKVQEYTQYQGTPYALPLSTEPYVVFYRTDIYKKLGLKPATTWSQFTSNAAACKKAGYEGSAMSYSSSDSVYDWATILYSLGGRMLNADNTKATLTTPQAVQATQILTGLLPYTPSGAVNGGLVDAISIFGSQKVCTMIVGTGNWESIYTPKQPNVYGKLAVSQIPQGPTVLFGWLIGLPTKTKNPEGGAKFLDYALSTGRLGRFVSAGAPPPGRNSLLGAADVRKSLPYIPVLLKAEAGAEHFPYIPQLPQILTVISQQLNSIATHGTSIQAGLAKAQSQVNGILGS
jgi:ABC-type glycerol-3-phosphate transport system substrate-binding protein